MISMQFTLEIYVKASNREKKLTKTPILGLNVVQGHRCWYHREALSYGENPESQSHRGLIRYRVVTPGQTDGRTDGRIDRHNSHS